MKIDIGIDPDSSMHGVAIAINDTLTHLKSMTRSDIRDFLGNNKNAEINLFIEDVKKNKSTFNKKGVRNARARSTVSRSIGMMQHALTELLRDIDDINHQNIKITYFPISKNWKDAEYGKEQLIKHFNYRGRSNEDTRSAAYFLYIGLYHNY